MQARWWSVISLPFASGVFEADPQLESSRLASACELTHTKKSKYPYIQVNTRKYLIHFASLNTIIKEDSDFRRSLSQYELTCSFKNRSIK